MWSPVGCVMGSTPNKLDWPSYVLGHRKRVTYPLTRLRNEKAISMPSGRISGRRPELGIGIGLSNHPAATCNNASSRKRWEFLYPECLDRSMNRACECSHIFFCRIGSVPDSFPSGNVPFCESVPMRGNQKMSCRIHCRPPML